MDESQERQEAVVPTDLREGATDEDGFPVEVDDVCVEAGVADRIRIHDPEKSQS